MRVLLGISSTPDQEWLRFATEKGSYNGKRYLPNITYPDGTILTKQEATEVFDTRIRLFGFESRVEARVVEGQFQGITDKFLIPPSSKKQYTTLHKYTSQVYVALTLSKTLNGLLNE
eukprot:Awhi_evm1s4220